MGRRGIIGLAWLPIVAALGCGDLDVTNDGPLPPNPEDWVCQDSVVVLSRAETARWCGDNVGQGEPLPPDLRSPPFLPALDEKNAFDDRLLHFIRSRTYANDLNWHSDRNWRMTGPYVGKIGSGEFFGVHSSAVRIYYSPEVIEWLCNFREGELPDGAMILKEQFPINEDLGITTDLQGCMQIEADPPPTNWTFFIKQNGASRDGWYQGSARAAAAESDEQRWRIGNPPVFDRSAITTEDFYPGPIPPIVRDPDWYPSGYLFLRGQKFPDIAWVYQQYGSWCINCHASAVSESTFATLVNVITPGTKFKQYSPDLSLLIDENFEGELHIPQRIALTFLESQNAAGFTSPFAEPLAQPTQAFLDFYGQIPPVPFSRAWEVRLPAESWDHQLAFAEAPPQFLTSDQCIGCHDATFFNLMPPNMLFETEQNGETTRLNLSPYAEWKASPLGQAGRDPIFFAQVQGETNFFADTGLAGLSDPKICIETTCLHCHGVMGQRQYQIDTEGEDDEGCIDLFGIRPLPGVPVGKPLSASAVSQWPGSADTSLERYGSLARDGISCTVCHHISPEGFGSDAIYTGNFITGPPDEIYGPYQEVVDDPMQNSLGITPQFGEQMVQADVCGTCHNILLPIVSNEGELLDFSYEQTTHLEWQNSVYAPGRSDFITCQGCHMPDNFEGQPLENFRIANIQSTQLPPVQNRLPADQVEVEPRERYARHTLHGLNVFLNEMFQEFPLLLGARQVDFMTGVATELPLAAARNSFLYMARNQTAEVAIDSAELGADGVLQAFVTVTNHAGHYLPSGVNFRRVFLEFLVNDAEGNILWASGRTNDVGAIIEGADGPVLPSELLLENPQALQPHYQRIEREDQVQIYQELVSDSAGDITTSFLRRVTTLKNNRIRPRGFDPAFFASNPSRFVQELAEIPGEARFDPYYTDPALTGADQIEYLVSLSPEAAARVDHVSVRVYNQSIPPFYLQQRFAAADLGPGETSEIDRLYYLTSHLNTDALAEDGEPFIEDWKLRLAEAAAPVGR